MSIAYSSQLLEVTGAPNPDRRYLNTAYCAGRPIKLRLDDTAFYLPLLLLYCTKDFDQDTVLCRCDWTTSTHYCTAHPQPTSMSTGCAELTGQSTLPSSTVSQCNRITSAASLAASLPTHQLQSSIFIIYKTRTT